MYNLSTSDVKCVYVYVCVCYAEHQYSHTGERPYKCELPGCNFTAIRLYYYQGKQGLV